MSSNRRRHRLRHIANPHSWFFRRPGGGQDQHDRELDAVPYAPPTIHQAPAWGMPIAEDSNPVLTEQREREEEEYNVALALSLSTKEQTTSIDLETQEEAQLARAKRASMTPSTSSGAAESLSWSLFTNNQLDWDDIVCDGLYDVWGQFPEILEIAPDSGITKLFPSLEELRKIPFTPGDSREVVVVDHDADPGLCTIDEHAAEAVSKAIKRGAEACAQALARVVVESMGGPSSAGELAQRCWDHMQQLKNRKSSLVLGIGEVKVGLARHRALLFKSLADACRLPCKAVRGEHLGDGATGDRAAVMVRLQDKLYSVDLFTSQLRLIGGKPGDGSTQVSARQSAVDASGLEWNGDLDSPTLLPLEGSSSQRSHSMGNEVSPTSVADRLRKMDTSEDLSDRRLLHERALSCSTAVPGSQRRSPAQQSLVQMGSRASTSSVAMQEPSMEYPPIVYSEGLQMLRETGPSTSGDAPPRDALQPPSLSLAENATREASLMEQADLTVSPFLNADFQLRGGDQDGEFLGGSYEFIDGRVAEVTPPNTSRPVAGPKGVVPDFSLAPSPFADPAVQDSEVPYENLPVDKGHLLPPLQELAEKRDSDALSASQKDCGHEEASPRQQAGREQAADEMPRLRMKDDKAHWKLRALANVRRHSDSDIFIDAGRRSSKERLVERLEALPELNDTSGQDTSPAGSPEKFEVPAAKPLVAVMHVASGDCSSSGLDIPEEWEIRPEELKVGPRIGIGSYGEVHRGVWRYTDVAVKRLIDQDLSPQLMEEFRAEIAIMKRLRHVNVLLFLGAVTAPPNLAIVTQFMPRGSLFRLLHRTPCLGLDERRRSRMALDIARGMNYLHSCVPPIVHRDLKSPNLLVDKDFTVKVCDFGLSRVRLSTVLSGKSQAGTPEWTAPEVLRSQAYDESSDCYSYGVILWELLTSKEPWHDKTAMQVVGAVGWGNARLQIPVGSHPAIASLITRCWSEPKTRPTFAEILQYLKPLGEEIFVCPPKAGSASSDSADLDASEAS